MGKYMGDKMRFVTKTPIEKGWSGDKKFCAVSPDGNKYFLRIAPLKKAERTRGAFEYQKRVAELGVPMCVPIEIGETPEGDVYTVQSWIEGISAEEAVRDLSFEEQYRYGVESGRILKLIHSIPAPPDAPDWEPRFNAKMEYKIKKYIECPIKVDGAECFIDCIEQNRTLLRDRPQCFQHGDYHIGNMMIENGKLVIIDFDRYDFGDPWEEFNRIVWCAQASPHFATGMVDGYFDNNVPALFWRLLALYISSNTLSSIPWAIPFGKNEIQKFVGQTKDIMGWYDNMRSVVPSWYDMIK